MRDVLGDQDFSPKAASGDDPSETLVRSEPRAEIFGPVSQDQRAAGYYLLSGNLKRSGAAIEGAYSSNPGRYQGTQHVHQHV